MYRRRYKGEAVETLRWIVKDQFQKLLLGIVVINPSLFFLYDTNFTTLASTKLYN
jgi:hypothetical protein